MWSILYYLRVDPAKLKNSLRKRGLDPSIVDKAVELDKRWRETVTELNKLRAEHNKLSAEIAKLPPEERKKKIEEAKKLLEKIKEVEEQEKRYKQERDNILLSLPNTVDEDVPEGPDENYNVPVKFFGKPKVYKEYLQQFFEQLKGWQVEYEVVEQRPRHHYEMEELGYVDTRQAGKVAGSRFYYMLGDILWLELALVLYAIDFLKRKGYVPVLPPYMLKRQYYLGAEDLQAFKDAIYEVVEEELCLIATAEHPIAAMMAGKVFEEGELPLKIVGFSPCFRKEAGAHGKDTKGIFRVHQFEKVEQFIFCKPEDSRKFLEELKDNMCELAEGLGIPYRLVLLCSGDMGRRAVKQYDLEGWFPGQGRYRELGSCSNCTDWQSYRLDIRYRLPDGSTDYVHTLNCTAIAVQRTIACIFENYVQEDGTIEIPRVLRKYLEPAETAPKDYIRPANIRLP
ncbi:MAG: serine--tRNA ligase [bacterium]|nr:serine--tRNA ligase [bacterium]